MENKPSSVFIFLEESRKKQIRKLQVTRALWIIPVSVLAYPAFLSPSPIRFPFYEISYVISCAIITYVFLRGVPKLLKEYSIKLDDSSISVNRPIDFQIKFDDIKYIRKTFNGTSVYSINKKKIWVPNEIEGYDHIIGYLEETVDPSVFKWHRMPGLLLMLRRCNNVILLAKSNIVNDRDLQYTPSKLG